MFLHNPVLDVISVFACLYIFQSFILGDETANEDTKLLLKHSKFWIRFWLWLCVLGSVIYMTLSDFSLIDGKYYVFFLHIPFAVVYIVGVYGNFVSYKYGPKDSKSREKNLHQLFSIIAMTILILFFCFL